MNELAKLFETNRVIVYSAYGQVFFVTGLAVLLQSRRHSQLALARHLWLLGLFGLLHGVSEWAYVFIPIQSQYLPAPTILALWQGHILVEALSFAFLFQFGVELVGPVFGLRWLRFLPGIAFAVWAVVAVFIVMGANYFAAGMPNQLSLRNADVLGRYLLALPGAILTAVGLFREARSIETLAAPGGGSYLRGAAVAFAAYAVFAGVLVEPAGFFPADVVNARFFWPGLGVPMAVFRSACGLAIAYCVVRGLRVFDSEMETMIKRIDRSRMLAVERERIGRELHDGTIQSIYAAGLALEDADHTIDEDAALAHRKVRQVMISLNRTVGDIRSYILDLHSGRQRSFEEELRALANEFASSTGLAPRLRINPALSRLLSGEQSEQLLQVAHEALANVRRHAAASEVELVLTQTPNTLSLIIRDNGRGFDPNAVARLNGSHAREDTRADESDRTDSGHEMEAVDKCLEGGLGLSNISHRVEMVGGTLSIRSAAGQGTRLEVALPLGMEAV